MGLFDVVGGAVGGALGSAFGTGGTVLGGLLGGLGGKGGAFAPQPPPPYNPGSYKDRTGIYAGAPEIPGYQQYGPELNTQGLEKYRQEATRTGPSAWAGLMGKQQEQEYQKALEASRGQLASQTAGAESALAMRGGLSSGARERLQKQGLLAQMQAGQNLSQQKSANLLQAAINDEQNRIAQLGALPGMELQALAPSRTREEALNRYAQDKYRTEAGIWGAGQQASMMDPDNPASPNYDDRRRLWNPLHWPSYLGL